MKNKAPELLKISLYFLIFLSVVPFLGKHVKLFDILSSFRIQFSIISLLYFSLACFKKYNKVFIGLSLLALTINISSIISNLWPNQTIKGPHTFSVLHSNILSSNSDFDSIFDLIKKKNPTIVGVQEVNPFWQRALEIKMRDYPYQKIHSANDNFGIALFSKTPFKSIDLVNFGKYSELSIMATIEVDHRDITLIYTHPLPPISSSYFAKRNEQLNSIAKYTATLKNTIVFGDFNMSPWSVHFKSFVKNSGLKHNSANILYTWPTHNPLVATPIDHYFSSPNLNVYHVEKLNDVGSDHFPLFAEISLP